MNYNFIIIIILKCLFLNTIYTQTSLPNVLLIIADDLGLDAINGFDLDLNNGPTTPNLESLQNNGVSYLNNWATPQCTPSRAAIFSGKYGVKTGVMEVGLNLDLEHESLFNYIKRTTNDNYATAMFGKWQLSSTTNPNHPEEHGLDHFEGIIIGGVNDYYSWNKIENGKSMQVDEYITSHLTTQAITWINEQDKPWIVSMSHIAPHSPFHVPPEGSYTINEPTSRRQQYYAAIEALDFEIGRLLDSLDDETRENTVIIFLGDNGTPNSVLRYYNDGNGKSSMYEGGLKVPMIISGANVSRKGEKEYGLTQAADLYATIIEVCSNELEGGIYNSLSIKSSLTNTSSINRDFIYSDYQSGDTLLWAIRDAEYKLIQDDKGRIEFYHLSEDPREEISILPFILVDQAEVLNELITEAEVIRTSWSCNDQILNGNEEEIDSCSSCPEIDVLSFENIGCCNSPEVPSVYHEFIENDLRNIYSNGFPNHDYCYNPNNIPEQVYNYFRINPNPTVAEETTSILRENGRPARHFGVALNGVLISPAPGTPFIFENTKTGEFNWDWVFEPTNNQGDGQFQVRLDCASAHTNPNGYHYHGEMFEYLETEQPGITDNPSITELFQIGWASDGFPILYKFGPDPSGNIKELIPSYQLKSGERPGDGISAPCGPYTGKYTNDYEYLQGLGDLDECNGISQPITLSTPSGSETFEYFYIVSSTFPQIPRCLVGTVSEDFENGGDPLTGIDNDSDGYLSDFECNDNNSLINPSQIEIPYNGLDDDCNATTLDDDIDQDGFLNEQDCDDTNAAINPDAMEILGNEIDENCDGNILSNTIELAGSRISIFPNPVYENLRIQVDNPIDFSIALFDIKGKKVLSEVNSNMLFVGNLPTGTYSLRITEFKSNKSITEKIIIK